MAKATDQSKHEIIERNVALMIVLTLLTVSVGGLVEIVPLFFQASLTKPVVYRQVDGKTVEVAIKPYDALRLTGRDIYVREGCYTCHSQMIRPFRSETERYGHYSVAAEFVYDRPFQWGSKRTGPDLARVGGRYSDSWHVDHLTNPRSVVSDSNMPAFPWLARTPADKDRIKAKMETLRFLGHPYTQEEIDAAPSVLEGKTELDALIAYLQGMGTALSNFK